MHFRPSVETGFGILVAWLVEINQKKKRRSLRKNKPFRYQVAVVYV